MTLMKRLYPHNVLVCAIIMSSLCLFASGCATTLTTYHRGQSYLKQGDYERAIEEFKLLLEKNPSDPATLFSIGVAYYSKGDYDSAISYLRSAKSADPNYVDAYIYLGMAYEQKGEYQSAMAEYDSGIARNPARSVRQRLEKRKIFLTREIVREEAKKALQDEAVLVTRLDRIPDNTVAVTNFTNIGQLRELDPLGKGLAGMLITDLSQVKAITLVERAKIQELLNEMKLEGVDESTSARPGMLLGASKIITGSFMSLDGSEINIVTSLTMTKTKTSRPSKSVSGGIEKLFELEKELAFGILEDMGIVPTWAEAQAIRKVPTRSLEAFMAYCRGLDLADRGMYREAEQEFRKALSIDPKFSAPKLELNEVSSLMVETKSLAGMENLRVEVEREVEKVSRLSSADMNATRGLISTPETAVTVPRGGGTDGAAPAIKTVEVEVIFP